MRVVIAGGHGKIALLLERFLAERGDQAVGLIRNPVQAADVQKAGAGREHHRVSPGQQYRDVIDRGRLRADVRRRRAGRGPQIRAGLFDGSRPAAAVRNR